MTSRSQQDLEQVFAASRFVAGARDRDPQSFAEWLAEGRFERVPAPAALREEILAAGAAGDDEAALMRGLRHLRQREMVCIAVRDILELAPLDETLGRLSDLADASCEAALRFARRQLVQRFGQPRDAQGSVVEPVLLGMGKLGGRELNFSSDIDLIWAYEAPGETCPEPGRRADGTRPLANEEFFAKLALDVGRILSAKTEHGFVFRVDTLLRPFGSVGALAWHFDALEEYYQVHGREWERYALIKARPVAGAIEAGQALLERLRPFVYRRYLDFNAIGNLRDLKRLIVEEVRRKGLEDNIKLGTGGIREIEFIAQAFQLMRGGQDAHLRDARLRPVLRYLGAAGLLPSETAAQLEEAYVFLRRLENAIQMYQDEQTHQLPQGADARSALCSALRVPDWPTLQAQIEATRALVQAEFERMFSERREATRDSPLERALLALFFEPDRAELLILALSSHGFGDTAAAVAERLRSLRESALVGALSEGAHRKLAAALACVLDECSRQSDPARAAARALEVVQAIAGRSTYLTLLRESATVRAQLVRLCAASPWIAAQLARTPAVLDQMLDPRTLYSPPTREELAAELAQRMSQLKVGDTEGAMEVLRRFRQEATLRIAAADITGVLPLVKVSDHLTWLAEVIIVATVAAVAAELRAQFGEPRRSDGMPASVAVIAYGKCGSLEMGYGSDVDLVFLHDCDALDADTVGGPRSIANEIWLSRLVQRVVNWLAAQTGAGRVYEIDLELRPDGRRGLTVTSLRAFAEYQRASAWTWEHQALIRARPIAGDAGLGTAFDELRREVLTRPRDPQRLRHEIIDMRRRMRANLEKRESGRWDVKQAQGGLIDAEFLTQFLILRDAHAKPELARWTDIWRNLDSLAAAGSITPEDAAKLVECCRAYRGSFHRRDLQQADHLAEDALFQSERSDIRALWRKYLQDA
jgi:glutamate-ammonia-ligase adenylyltransferase